MSIHPAAETLPTWSAGFRHQGTGRGRRDSRAGWSPSLYRR